MCEQQRLNLRGLSEEWESTVVHCPLSFKKYFVFDLNPKPKDKYFFTLEQNMEARVSVCPFHLRAIPLACAGHFIYKKLYIKN